MKLSDRRRLILGFNNIVLVLYSMSLLHTFRIIDFLEPLFNSTVFLLEPLFNSTVFLIVYIIIILMLPSEEEAIKEQEIEQEMLDEDSVEYYDLKKRRN